MHFKCQVDLLGYRSQQGGKAALLLAQCAKGLQKIPDLMYSGILYSKFFFNLERSAFIGPNIAFMWETKYFKKKTVLFCTFSSPFLAHCALVKMASVQYASKPFVSRYSLCWASCRM